MGMRGGEAGVGEGGLWWVLEMGQRAFRGVGIARIAGASVTVEILFLVLISLM
jgi:hypothetical protein